MKDLLMRVRVDENIKLSDDQFVEDCMTALTLKYPQIVGYTYERSGADLLILMWGEL